MNGTILADRYELIEKIGEGGMALVFKAKCTILDRIVAIKVLKEEYAYDSTFVEKFRTEAHSAASLSHPNIVNIYDVGRQDNIHFIVMEYVEGHTLKELIAEKAPLSNELAIDIALMICDGIHHAHEKGIIHKDIKPHNILITNSGMVKVADFGIAQAASKKTITFGGNILGSVQYISPEQAKGEPLTRATDIYSVGCVLYEMLTGKVPFDAESPVTIALKHIHDEPELPRELNSDIPPSLEKLIFKAMAKVPSHRFSTAEQMRNSLLSFHTDKGNKFSYRPGKDNTIMMPSVSGEGKNNYRGKKKINTGRLAIVIVAIIGLLSGILYVAGGNFFGQEVVVPNIVGKDVKEAKNELEKQGLKMAVSHEEFNEEFEINQVVSQDPKGEMKVKEGREIKVVLSKGVELFSIPSLVGLNIADAELEIKNQGFVRGKIDKTYDSKYGENIVISQKPTSGTKSEKNTTIDLMISQGEPPKRIAMPNLIGKTLDEARSELQKNKLIPSEINKKDSNEYFANIVIEQDVAAGVLVDEETNVVITVSKGPGPVAQTKAIQFKLPEEQDFYKVVIRVSDSKGKREVYNEISNAGEDVYIGVSYFGKGVVEILLNGKVYDTIEL